ncbi:MAG TPA: hypothetical protein DIS53_03500 [Candidatus Wildermuthbacteria bacterium]|uniref:Uncharacterized protein n=1 Tax=Candidatus Yanofskybacteria bacterium GW2011_GWC1_48_11 TaxID=1619027 RepID=A0A837IP07_9BACT|nr:MAG: hypothetical protein UY25_C0002G0059 [Candidatus Yanofskybacteria bacterium GW2011_GWC1_48_11]KKW04693.1 MAG: hypothetical protein UY38_C0001G0260 [Parcubacteria group bacterium GW2011_GWB1_49_12]KKW09007.1 MAG: hypothetical protein UY45_C0002G0059 [Parcubacteria group bacterium GW2011_GWA1_49_26]KKW14223.1 MAG: hypothetical protein UY53_C0002G0012 [Parcubacteria group bacterium GW2011_GWA2_50_10]OHA61060.1 MAG: hypothetical protein A2109_02295 [Candidatus Wildermuthbacteria bacterium G
MIAIQIIEVPAGEAPGWVREEWVGCILPAELVGATWAKGVRTGAPHVFPFGTWYWVAWERAVRALESQGKGEAADWWRSTPHPPDEYLLFRIEECKVVPPD